MCAEHNRPGRDGRDTGHWGHLTQRTIEQLFAERRQLLAGESAHPEPLHSMRIDQVETEIRMREMDETVGDLINSLEAFADTFYSAPLPYLTLDICGRIRCANQRAERLFSRQESHLKALPLGVLFPRQGAAIGALLRRIEASPKSGLVRRLSLTAYKPRRPLQLFVIAQLDDLSRITGFAAIVTRRSSKTLSPQGRRLQLMHRVHAALATIDDGAGTIERVTQAIAVNFACICAVDLVDAGGQLRRRHFAHHRRVKAAGTPRLAAFEALASDGYQGVQAQVLAEGEPRLVAHSRASDRLQGGRAAGFETQIVVRVPGVPSQLGTLTLVRAWNRRPFRPADLRIAQQVAEALGQRLCDDRRRRELDAWSGHLAEVAQVLHDGVDELLGDVLCSADYSRISSDVLARLATLRGCVFKLRCPTEHKPKPSAPSPGADLPSPS